MKLPGEVVQKQTGRGRILPQANRLTANLNHPSPVPATSPRGSPASAPITPTDLDPAWPMRDLCGMTNASPPPGDGTETDQGNGSGTPRRRVGRPPGSGKGRRRPKGPRRVWCVLCTRPATRKADDGLGGVVDLCDQCPDPDQITQRAERIRDTWSTKRLRENERYQRVEITEIEAGQVDHARD